MKNPILSDFSDMKNAIVLIFLNIKKDQLISSGVVLKLIDGVA
ncbi:MAG: hypothetical protein QGF78_06955 [Candidatus Bathyarchaeota archaeon]|nr:hypothetical protein [Candidatus Bathyarchaeota archaeon]